MRSRLAQLLVALTGVLIVLVSVLFAVLQNR